MTDETLKNLLSTYTAPTPDNGFSDAVMARVQQEAEANTLSLSEFSLRPNIIRRSWVVSLILGFICGSIWVRLGVQVPDIPDADGLMRLLSEGWTLYALCGFALCGLFLMIESETI